MPMDKEASVRLEVAQGPASHSIQSQINVFSLRCSRDRGSDAIVLVFVRPTKTCHVANCPQTIPETNPTISCRDHCPSWPRHFVLLVLLDQALLDQVSQALLVVLDQALGLASFGMNPAATAVSGQARNLNCNVATSQVFLCPLDSSSMTASPRPRRHCVSAAIVPCGSHRPGRSCDTHCL